ncbi:MAG: FGGY-family carbohydrate kinase [Microthrixaceae bacterium]
MSILVIDVGTSGVRAAVLRSDGTLAHEVRRVTLPDTPVAGLVEFDAEHYAQQALDCAREVLAANGPVDAVGISNQRTSTIVWDRATGVPVAPAQGWQDLRTLGDCLTLNAEGFHLAPNQSATKLANILDSVDPDRQRDLCFGTPDSWLIWKLTNGAVHASDHSNAAVWGLLTGDGAGLDHRVLDRLRIPESMIPRIVPSTGHVGQATALDGSPPICGVAGDQQASLIGQGCIRPGMAKITFGTGGMLDVCTGPERPRFDTRGAGGTFPLVCWRDGDDLTWGVEGIMLSAGTNVEWLRDDLGLIPDAESSEAIAASVESTDGVVYVPALLGLGTPYWDYGARGTLLGITRGTQAPHIVRAVLEGVANRGADLVDAAEKDCDMTLESIRIDGGMSRNSVFVQALADATQRTVEVSPVTEATALGAGFLAGLDVGTWQSWDEIGARWNPAQIVEPASGGDRDRWHTAVERSRSWYPELSALDF